MRARNALILAALAASATWLAACDEDGIRSYEVPKGRHADADVGTTPQADAPIDWRVPEGWRKLAGKRSMRVATFEADGPAGPVQIAVSVLPGDAGGILANVNRWRGQLGLGPIARTDLGECVESLAIDGREAFLVDLADADAASEEGPPRRIVVAVVPLEGATWFVKAIGRSSVVEPHKNAITQFARSFRARPAH